MNLVVAISGATGAIYGVRLLEVLHAMPQVTTYVVLSHWARQTIPLETGRAPEEVLALADRVFDDDDLAAAISSGSFRHDGMAVLPCSMKTLSAIANGYSETLIARAADVTLKERRPLVLAVRETPLSPIHLENMLKLSRIGAVIMPPVPSFYSRPASLEQVVDQFVGRVLDSLGVEGHSLCRRWDGAPPL